MNTMTNFKEKLTEEGESYMDACYDCDVEVSKKNWFVGVGKSLMVASLNYAGECDEAHPEHDFIAGVMWERQRTRRKKPITTNTKEVSGGEQ